MLGKLLKYELKAMGRIMLPLYLAMLFVAGVFAVNMKMGMNPSVKSLVEKIALISGLLFVVAVMAVGVVMAVMVVQRFYRNLLGTEGYLMFSLPATTMEQILSKGISALIWILLGGVAGVASGLLMVGIVSSVPEFLKELEQVRSMFLQNKVSDLILLVVVLLLGTLESLCKVYAAIAVGHQFNGHRLLASVGAYIAFGIVELVISLPLSTDDAMFGKVINLVSDTGKITLTGSMWMNIGILVIGILAYGFVSWYLLDKRLNLE